MLFKELFLFIILFCLIKNSKEKEIVWRIKTKPGNSNEFIFKNINKKDFFENGNNPSGPYSFTI